MQRTRLWKRDAILGRSLVRDQIEKKDDSQLWLERNRRIFRDDGNSSSVVLQKTVRAIAEWLVAHGKMSREQGQLRQLSNYANSMDKCDIGINHTREGVMLAPAGVRLQDFCPSPPFDPDGRVQWVFVA
ncbi:unnamed protein product, partial [Linum tenue]